MNNERKDVCKDVGCLAWLLSFLLRIDVMDWCFARLHSFLLRIDVVFGVVGSWEK